MLSVPATYDEPKGMFLIEAMASGVPVVQPRRGAFIEVVEKTGGGLLVDVDDPREPGRRAVSRCGPIASLLRTLGERAFAGVREHYTIAAVGRSAARSLQSAVGRPAAASASVA